MAAPRWAEPRGVRQTRSGSVLWPGSVHAVSRSTDRGVPHRVLGCFARRGTMLIETASVPWRVRKCSATGSWSDLRVREQKLGVFPTQHAIVMGDKEYHSAVNIGATMKARYNNWRHTGW